MKNKSLVSIVMFVCLCLLSADLAAQQWPGLRDSVYSDILKEKRVIQVLFPGEYNANPEKKYEVLYVLDGEWYMEQIPFIYNFAMNSGYVPPCIFVLIPNTYVNGVNLRDRDFSPTRIENVPTLGGADNFHSFLKDELIPYVEKKYRTNGYRSLVGSSFSGLFAVYAFVKEPQLFQSFVASDPNLNWDNNFISKLASKKLPEFTKVNSTLYIAGLTSTFGGMGISAMDSVLQAKAPASIHWKCIPYENETHYSVQHKAFYDGFRFSHFGYSTTSGAEYHPMSGILEKDKPLKVFVLRENPAIHYTTDGTEPTSTSPVMSRQQMITVSGPSQLKMKLFSNRPSYAYASQADFRLGEISPSKQKSKNAKANLNYTFYEGDWNKLPALKSLKPVQSGVVDKEFTINKIIGQKNSAIVVDGSIEIKEDGYYVFYAQSKHGSKVLLANQLLIELDGSDGVDARSFVVPLKKGFYPVHLEFLGKQGSPIHFFVRHTKSGNDKWWENEFLTL